MVGGLTIESTGVDGVSSGKKVDTLNRSTLVDLQLFEQKHSQIRSSLDYVGGKIADTTELIRGKLQSLTENIDKVELNLFTEQEKREADKRVYYRIEQSKFATDPLTASFIEKYR